MKPTPQSTPETLPEDRQEPTATPSALDQALEGSKRLARRHRRQLAPLVIMAVTCAMGIAAHTATGPAGIAVVAAGAAGAAGMYAYTRRRTGRWGSAYALLGGSASSVWLSVAAIVGPYGPMQTILWLGGAAIALPWWIRYSEPTPDVTAEKAAKRETPTPRVAPEPESVPEPLDWRAVRWEQHMGKTGKLAGSRLSNITAIRYGWTAVVEQVRGQHWSQVASQAAVIASIYDLPDGRVLIEPIPGAPVHKVKLVVLTDNPLEHKHRWPGPSLDIETGLVPLAVTGDGQMLHWRLWRPGAGTSHGLIAGTTGSGKTGTAGLLLAEVANSDRFVPVVIDGSGGMSLPDWMDHARYTATDADEGVVLLERLVQGMDARFAHLSQLEWTDERGRKRKGVNSVDPTPEMPGIFILIDEAHRLLMDERHGKRITHLLRLLTQMGRKVAISVVLVTQQPSASQLGGSTVLKDMVKSGTVVALRTAESVTGGLISRVPLPEPLHLLPEAWPDGSPTHGLGYITTARPIRCRMFYVEDPYAEATSITTPILDPMTDGALQGIAVPAETPRPASKTSVPAPQMHIVTDPDDVGRVGDALEQGVPAEPLALARATGLRWSTVKQVLKSLNEG